MNTSEIFVTETFKAIPSFVISLITLALGWIVGQRLTVYWNLHQKKRELDLATAQQFHSLYGEFFAVWKLWNYYIKHIGADKLPGSSRWELLERACKAESAMEAMLVRLALERDLSKEQIENLGRFRQAYQSLRETIRDNQPLSWKNPNDPPYRTFKYLASEISFLILSEKDTNQKIVETRTVSLLDITSNRWINSWISYKN